MTAHASHVAVLLALGFVAVSSTPSNGSALAPRLRGGALSVKSTKPKQQPLRNWNPMCLGIIGGAGPQASEDVVSKMIEVGANSTWYYQARDMPTIYLESSSKLDGVTQNNWAGNFTPSGQIANIGYVLEEIRDRFPKCVREYGAFGLACNTIHAYVHDKFNGDNAFVSLINVVNESIEREVATRANREAFVLGSQVTMTEKLSEYGQLWESFDVNPGIPESALSDLWDNVILKVQQNEKKTAHDYLKSFLKKYVNDSSIPVALTCTELPIAASIGGGKFIEGYNFIDPNMELAKAVVKRGEERLHERQHELEKGWKSGIESFEEQCCVKSNPSRDCKLCCEGNIC